MNEQAQTRFDSLQITNGVGKTSLLDAWTLLARSARRELVQAVADLQIDHHMMRLDAHRRRTGGFERVAHHRFVDAADLLDVERAIRNALRPQSLEATRETIVEPAKNANLFAPDTCLD